MKQLCGCVSVVLVLLLLGVPEASAQNAWVSLKPAQGRTQTLTTHWHNRALPDSFVQKRSKHDLGVVRQFSQPLPQWIYTTAMIFTISAWVVSLVLSVGAIVANALDRGERAWGLAAVITGGSLITACVSFALTMPPLLFSMLLYVALPALVPLLVGAITLVANSRRKAPSRRSAIPLASSRMYGFSLQF